MKVKIKKAFKYLFQVVIGVLFTAVTHAQSIQKIGTNQNTISISAALELESTTKGFLPPRMTTTQRNALASPTVGLVVYNTTTNCLEQFNGTGWYNECDRSITFLGGGDASSGGTAVVSAWTSTVGCRVGAGANNSPAGIRQGGVNQTMVQGTSATGVATVTLVATVTTAGTYVISTTTVNGVTFSASGTFGTTGAQTVTLTANGTPTYAGNYIWVLNQTTTTASLKNIYGSVLTTNAPLGSSYNAHFNGIIGATHVGTTYLNASQTTGETFNNNTTCQNQSISAQGCAGVTTVTTSSGRVHNTININGQCWLQTNLIEVPSLYKNYTTTSWSNSSIPGDQGYWGYYNTVTEDGTAGFGATEPGTNEGMLYQWCGAMNGAISERSRGICPAGWHIPSDCEWMYLEHGMGMSIAEQNVMDIRANNNDNQGMPGYKLIAQDQESQATNASGFSGLFAGGRYGMFLYRLYVTFYWTSTRSKMREYNAGVRGIEMYNPSEGKFGGISRFEDNAQAYSVRCLKD
jgi:uncharacterized protein (TIGR02145 family)